MKLRTRKLCLHHSSNIQNHNVNINQNNTQIQIGASSHNRLLTGYTPLTETSESERTTERKSRGERASNRTSAPAKTKINNQPEDKHR